MDLSARPATAVAGAAIEHDSARLHVTGEATYTDDVPEPQGTLYAALGCSPVAHGRLRSVDLSRVRAAAEVVDAIVAADLPAANNVGPIVHDDPILAAGLVQFVGQPVCAVLARSLPAARAAARLARFDLEPLPAILTIDAAREAESWVLPPAHLARGDAASALRRAPHRLAGTVASGGQDHFYLEGQVSLAIPQEDGAMLVYCSTQHPGEVQHLVAAALGVADHRVTVVCRRMGGGFGGKETQMSQFACIAAIFARRRGCAVKLRLDRDDDMVLTGKRHAFRYDYDVGYDDDGRILGLDLTLSSRCGFSADLSGPINDRAMFHADNCYWLPDVALHSFRCKTHTVSDTAFRGFGGPQGMFAIEWVIDEVARALGKDPFDVRRANLYGTAERNVTPYGMTVDDNVAPQLIDQLARTSDYRARRGAIAAWNRGSPILKRGIALTPVKFGISFTATHYNQAGALLHLYADGSLLLNHGGTEMGQGLYTKVAQVVAQELGVSLARIGVSAADTSKVPNASPTAASSGSDMNGMAAQDAARKLKAALTQHVATRFGVEADSIAFSNDEVRAGEHRFAFAEIARSAYFARVPLSATGFYATPKIHYDRTTLTGRPFYYFAYGAAVSEVVIDTLTGETRLLQVDILHDAGTSLNPAIDRGQIEGGFLQGYGWLTMEALAWDDTGALRTHSPSTYKIPTAREWPLRSAIAFFDQPNREATIHRSKAVGEPPLMLALSAFHAIRDALASVAPGRAPPRLDAPATPEAILRAVGSVGGNAPPPGAKA